MLAIIRTPGIIEAIIAMAHHLNLQVVAEGVETKEQRNFLTLRKCDLIQGNYCSKSLTVEQMTTLLQKAKPPKLLKGK